VGETFLKRTLIKAVSRFTWISGLDRLIHAVNRRRGGVILAYHHISGPALERQLELLSRWYTFVSLDEFVGRHTQGRTTSGLLVITFDDGFAEEVEAGAALAVARGWPMTFYLPTGYILSGRPYWFIRLAALMQAAPPGLYRVDDQRIKIGGDLSREMSRRRIARGLFGRPSGEIESFLDQLDEILFPFREAKPKLELPAPISVKRVAELARQEEISFQAHSVSHPYLAILSEGQIRQEMEVSSGQVEDIAGQKADHFCYPYGTIRSIGPRAQELARRLFSSATTSVRARCRPGTDRSLLPRITMHEHYTPGMTSLKVKITR
jgi:peptidoglycan/xylan/chitin deacetylase (PgdA/CDA1 family)